MVIAGKTIADSMLTSRFPEFRAWQRVRKG